MRTFLVFALAVVLVAAGAGKAGAQACSGDCDGDGQVEIAELVRGVRIALGEAPVSDCAAMDRDGDGAVTISELIVAVRAAIEVCIADTPTPAPTATLAPPACGDSSADPGEECDDGNTDSGDGCSLDCQLEPGGDVCAGVASTAAETFRFELVVDGLDDPVHAAAPPLDPFRLFVVEQPGRIRLVELDGGGLRQQPFLDISQRVASVGGNDERGLFSIAFHPDYENNGWFFVNYTCRSGGCPAGVAANSTVISRFERSADPGVADADSETVLLTVPQPYTNHNGGQNAFGPDGFLYVGMGDGGSFDDPREAGQDDGTLLGKLLRIDVDVAAPPYWSVPADNPSGRDDALGLIWAKGLRNPWRFSFDRANGDLYVADVGQDTLEEIDVQPGNSAGGENYGWDIFEGTSCLNDRRGPSSCPASDEGLVRPVLEYGHGQGVSVTGGFVYRGCALAVLRGHYFYSDFSTYWVRTFVYADGVASQQMDRTASIALPAGRNIRFIASYGEDARGELYVVDRNTNENGAVYKLVAAD